jgi:hypothetical protein
MSLAELGEGQTAERVRERTDAAYETLVRVVFGDHAGLAVFLLALAFFMLYWRIGFFINDNFTIGNTLVAVADGHLHFERIVYGPERGAPGTYTYDGQRYGRNYGQVFFALPFLVVLRGLAIVADPRIVLIALWALVLLALLVLFTNRWENPYSGVVTIVGSAVVLALFLGNVAVAHPLEASDLPAVALQFSTMVAAALAAVMLYRFCKAQGLPRTGLFVGIATALASPVGFWSSLPKRHILIALLALTAAYTLFLARRAEPRSSRALRWRAIAYGWVGLAVWVSAPEGGFILAAIGLADVLTAEDWRPRTVATVTGAFLVSLLPFFVTNTLISGNPLLPPFLLMGGLEAGTGGGAGTAARTAASTTTATATATPTPTPSGGGSPAASALAELASKFAGVFSLYLDPPALATKFWNVFIRSGYLPNVTSVTAGEAITLSIVESAPLVGGVVALPAVAYRSRGRILEHLQTPAGAAHFALAAYTLVLTLFYLPRLPGHVQLTVRYLTPMYPVLIYATARIVGTETLLANTSRTFLWSYGAIVLFGSQITFAFLIAIDAQIGESIQFLALVGICGAIILGLYALVESVRPGLLPDRAGAVALAVATGTGTTFLLMTGLYLFAYTGNYALPLVREFVGALA